MIYINGRFFSQNITGVQRFAFETLVELDTLFSDVKFKVVILLPSDIGFVPDFKFIEKKVVGRFRGHLWEQLELPLFSRDGLLLNLCNSAPLLKRNQIVTIHDLAVFRCPLGFSFAFGTWYRVLFWFVSRFSRKILTVSEFSRLEILDVLRPAKEKMKVISEGAGHIFRTDPDESVLERHGLAQRPFILAVSSLNPNKNFRCVVEAASLLESFDYEFVIAGGTNPKVFRDSDLALPKNVKYIGYVTDAELRALYEHAFAFVFPSFYEGFGLPPLEAMACGCPVILSDRSSLPEVGGEAALYCNPDDPADLARQIQRLIADEALRERCHLLGQKQAAKFTWSRGAEELGRTLEEFCK